MNQRVINLNNQRKERAADTRQDEFAYRDNLARETQPKREPERMPLPPTRRQAERTVAAPKEKSRVRPSWLLAFTAVAALYLLVVSSYMQLTEISVANAKNKSEITELNKQITALETQQNERVNYTMVEQAAENAGMVKLSKSGVEYLNLENGDVLVTVDADGQETVPEKAGFSYFWKGISELFANIIDYID